MLPLTTHQLRERRRPPSHSDVQFQSIFKCTACNVDPHRSSHTHTHDESQREYKCKFKHFFARTRRNTCPNIHTTTAGLSPHTHFCLSGGRSMPPQQRCVVCSCRHRQHQRRHRHCRSSVSLCTWIHIAIYYALSSSGVVAGFACVVVRCDARCLSIHVMYSLRAIRVEQKFPHIYCEATSRSLTRIPKVG